MCIFAYGQTGCGKTYTMEGDFTQVKQRGIIPRSVEKIFHELKMNQDLKNELYVTFQEVYNENIYDLLSEDENK